ncbi:hypothetical protein M409DRAFT_67494 [Zasmidium cellare ATCC 36951]|uniref:Peptidase C45 hydrolase domain-containing protein n=1 Tax=Zasmidium cellare ATCC 36951 TaxID=1080233 RepID=A0A6A6CHT2_ZASCE|nr:uncharacterized protein M409DRAFT_67494 [Zasmidium cellare ATCC 36951]KAF2165249.1 hypothetical protein M409DRAFT_67494 [Zasmidium cellare ATCC 36951]
MLSFECHGSPFEIGLTHGTKAKPEIERCIAFYADVFQKTVNMSWDAVQDQAKQFDATIAQKWPHYHEEIKGIAQGSEKDVLDIIALNVRTEIMFGCYVNVSDGCTSFAWRSSGGSFLAQNWDWMERQRENLVLLTVQQPEKPTIKMVTEAGIIGKIGMNSAGVGVCLNAIRVGGVGTSRIPCHLGLRLALDSKTREDAVEKLQEYGVASACHMLVADETGSVGLEWSSTDLQKLDMNDQGQVFHSNHYIVEHPGLDVKPWLADSDFRLDRIEKLCNAVPETPTTNNLLSVLEDEKNYPAAICRAVDNEAGIATLFSILMDLKSKSSVVRLGRPSAPEEVIHLKF